MNFNSRGRTTAPAVEVAGTFAVLLLVLFPTGNALAQGLPVEMGSHIPVYLWFIGAAILGLAIAYGIMRNRSRSSAEKKLSDQATRTLYAEEERRLAE